MEKKLLFREKIYVREFFRYFYLVYFVTSCANIGTITGGDPDKTPPLIKREYPPNFHTYSKTNQIVLTFDEYLATTNLRSEITITPEPRSRPKYEIKGKSISIKFDEPLDSNTTYIINFGKGIADLNENNVLEGYFYVFSTGEHIDSNYIHGKVLDVITSQPIPFCLVGLYTSTNTYQMDSILYHRPDYYTKTDSNGYFKISYLPVDSFKIVAFTDKNNDFKIQPESELVGAYPEQKYSADSTPVNVYIAPQIPPKKPLIYRLTNPYSCFATYQTPIHSYKTENLTKNSIQHIHRTKNRDTLLLFFKDEIKDSATLRLISSVSTDTLRLLRRQIDNEKLQLQRSTRADVSVNDPIHLSASYPIWNIDKDKIEIISDDSVSISKAIEISYHGLSIQVDFEKVSKKKYTVRFLPNAVFFNDLIFNIDTFSFDFNVKEKEDFGEIAFELNLDTILNNIYLVLEEIKTADRKEVYITQKNTRLSFKELTPGAYQFWIYWDKNDNKWWDKGDIFSGRNPEVKIINSDNIEVRANWEIEYTWDLSLSDAIRRFGY